MYRVLASLGEGPTIEAPNFSCPGTMTSFSNDAKYVAKLQAVEQHIAGNQLKLAAQALNELKKKNPGDPRLYLLGSRMAAAANNWDGEFQLAQRAYKIAPDWAIGSLEFAKVLAKGGKHDEALALAEQAVRQAAETGGNMDLIMQAIALAYQLGDYEKTLRWLRQAEMARPEDLSIRYKIGSTLVAMRDLAGAITIFDQLIALEPTNAALLGARFSASLAASQPEQALLDAQALVTLEPDNEEYRFYLAFARGENPPAMPASLVGKLFNGFAANFDRQMVVQQQYKLPRDLAQMIHTWHPDKKVDVLDLGCGTGLLGVCLGPQEGVLVGVDLSTEMTNQALRHQVYHRLHQVNLLDALRETPADQYHVITSLDVLIYIGDLEPVVDGALRILMPGGRFVFSIELNAEDTTDFTLHNMMRYTHKQSYVEGLLQRAGFCDVVLEQRVIRLDTGVPVQGLLITARKPLEPTQKPARKAAPRSKKAAQ